MQSEYKSHIVRSAGLPVVRLCWILHLIGNDLWLKQHIGGKEKHVTLKDIKKEEAVRGGSGKHLFRTFQPNNSRRKHDNQKFSLSHSLSLLFPFCLCLSRAEASFAESDLPEQQTKQAADAGKRSSGARKMLSPLSFTQTEHHVNLLHFSFFCRGVFSDTGLLLGSSGRGGGNSWCRVRHNNITDEHLSFFLPRFGSERSASGSCGKINLETPFQKAVPLFFPSACKCPSPAVCYFPSLRCLSWSVKNTIELEVNSKSSCSISIMHWH